MSLAPELIRIFSQRSALGLNEGFSSYACVAVILRGDSWQNLELAFIRRATRFEDSWSGQVAFPGGKGEPADKSDLETAIRETQEEVGIRLRSEELMGALDDIQGSKGGLFLDFYIRPFVFFIERDLEVTLNKIEVAEFFWVALSELRNPLRQTTYEISHKQLKKKLPAINLGSETPLWGLTYIMSQNLINILPARK